MNGNIQNSFNIIYQKNKILKIIYTGLKVMKIEEIQIIRQKKR